MPMEGICLSYRIARLRRPVRHLIEPSIAVIIVVTIVVTIVFFFWELGSSTELQSSALFILTSGGAIAIAAAHLRSCRNHSRPCGQEKRPSPRFAGAPRVTIRVYVDVVEFIFYIVLAISRSSDSSLLLNHKHGRQPKKTAVSVFRFDAETPRVQCEEVEIVGLCLSESTDLETMEILWALVLLFEIRISPRGRLDMPD